MTEVALGPRISVVLPSFNQVRYLETAILSVIRQEYEAIELIVVDGGSTDGSAEVIDRYSSRITSWRSHPDGGQAAAIAEGMVAATGDILSYLNSDDVYLPGALARVAWVLGPAASSPAWAIGGSIRIDERGRRTRFDRPMRVTQRSMLVWGSGFSQPAAFWNRALLERVGGVDERFRFCLDYDMFLRFAGVVRPTMLGAYVAAFRDHPASKSATLAQVHADELGQVRRDYTGSVDGRSGWVDRAAWLWYWACWKALRLRAVTDGPPCVPAGWLGE